MKIFHRVNDVCVFQHDHSSTHTAMMHMFELHLNWFDNAKVEYLKREADFPFEENRILVGYVIPDTTMIIGDRVFCDISYTLYSSIYRDMKYAVRFKFRGFHPCGLDGILIHNL